MNPYFIKTNRIGFSHWTLDNCDLASLLWGEADVTRYLCISGIFSSQDIHRRFDLELHNQAHFHVQYWPIFRLETGELIGCCGLRPFPSEPLAFELGFHLRRAFWHQGYAFEAAKTVIAYAFETLHADKLLAGHHPQNLVSSKLLLRLGFQFTGNNFYEPTGLYHPSYEQLRQNAPTGSF